MDATHSAWDRWSVCLMITGRKLLLSNCAEGGREVVYSEAVRPRGNSAGGRKNQNCVKIICVTKNADSGRGAVPAPFCLNPHFVVCTFFVALWRLRRRLLRIHFLPWNFFKFNFPPSLPPSLLPRSTVRALPVVLRRRENHSRRRRRPRACSLLRRCPHCAFQSSASE